jgi:hypothetical protein
MKAISGAVIALGVWISCGQASAATYCVRDGNELQQALNDAAASWNDDEIRLHEGIYTVFNQPFTYTAQTAAGWMFITGGWVGDGSNDCAHQRMDATRTLLDGAGQHQVLLITYAPPAGSTITTRIGLQNFTIGNGFGDPALNQSGGGLNLASLSDAYAELWLDNMIVSNNSAVFGGGASLYAKKGMLRVVNSLFSNNHATLADAHIAATALATDPGATSAVIIANSTFVDGTCPGNGGRGCGIRVGLGGGVRMDIVNTLFHDNAISDLDLEGLGFIGLGDGTAYADYSRIDLAGGSVVLNATHGLSGDPRFVDAPNRDYRLRDDSPLINQGLGAVPLYPFIGIDIHEALRTRFGAMDVGALENQSWDFMFANGFEAVPPAL